jgi:O-methyltransferase
VTPFELHFGCSFFAHKQRYPAAGQRFATVMSGVTGYNRGDEAAEVWDWASMCGTVVDIAGSLGYIAIAIAKRAKALKFIVEDLPDLTERANAHIKASGVSERVSFLGHDMFTPQPGAAKGATAYFLSRILHDWADDKCREILKHIVAVMEPSSSILLFERVLPEPGQMLEIEEADLRSHDLAMFSLLGAKERSVKDFEILMTSVDPSLGLRKVIYPLSGREHTIIEFRLNSKN